MNILDLLLDDFIYEHIIQQSLDTHEKELFQKKEQYQVHLPRTTVTGLEDTDKCFICLEPIEKNDSVYTLPCKHQFHCACLDTSVSFQHFNCPTCRHPIPIRDSNEHSITYNS